MNKDTINQLNELLKLMDSIRNWADAHIYGLTVIMKAVEAHDNFREFKPLLYSISELRSWYDVVESAMRDVIHDHFNPTYRRKLDIMSLSFRNEIDKCLKNAPKELVE